MRVKLNHYSATAVLACAGCAVLLCAGNARASTIIIGGTITQDTQDVGSPAVANPALNKIEDSDRFSVTLTPAGLLSSTGSYQLTSTTFLDPVRAAFESGCFRHSCNQSGWTCRPVLRSGLPRKYGRVSNRESAGIELPNSG